MSPDALSDEGTAAKPAILVSACLLGVACDHTGGSRRSEAVVALSATARLIPICPEVAGGLPTPRSASVLREDGRVVAANGSDATDSYRRGAVAAVTLARAVGASRAVLKARSPSCGCNGVYASDGSGTVVPGMGITAAALAAAGLELSSEEDELPPTMVRPAGA